MNQPQAHSVPPRIFPTAQVLLRCLLRTWLVGAGFNTRGMQNVGLAYAMDPGLVAIYGPGDELRAARKRYAVHYNTHPFWTPLLVGLFLGMEKKISRGLLTAESFSSVRETTIYTLSAIGDSFFGGSLLALWSLASACLILSGHGAWAVALGVVCFLALAAFKMTTFWLGYTEGLVSLQRLKKWDLINWGQRFKLVNAALLVAIWSLAWEGAPSWYGWLTAVSALGLFSALIWKTSVSREILAALVLAVYLGLPWIGSYISAIF